MDEENSAESTSNFSGELDSARPQSYTPPPITPIGSEGLPNPDMAGPAAKRRILKKLLKVSVLVLVLGAILSLGWSIWS